VLPIELANAVLLDNELLLPRSVSNVWVDHWLTLKVFERKTMHAHVMVG